MTCTQYGPCDNCDLPRVELVPMYVDEHIGNVLVCHKCGF